MVALVITPNWLSDDQQRAWRAVLEFSAKMLEGVDTDVAPFDLTGADYDVLVHLSEAKDEGLRMTELASRVFISKSRLTYRVDRLEARGLVVREVCETDRRGFTARLTESGRKRLAEVAPHHVSGVRSRLIEPLSAEEFVLLGELASKVIAGAPSSSPREVSYDMDRRSA